MGCKVKLQLIERKDSRQWLFNIPAAIGEAMELKKGELLDLSIKNRNYLAVKRVNQR